MSQHQVTTKPEKSDIRSILSSPAMKQRFADVLPKHLSPERYARVALAAMSRTPKLANCTQESLLRCLLDLSAFGLEPDGRRAHLIPYGDTCTLVIDWKGLAELAMRSGIIAKMHADVVCENDEFDFNLGEITRHKINFKHPRGEPYAAYAMAVTKDGPVFVQVLTKDEIEGIRDNSQGYKAALKYNKDSPWTTAPGEMWKKTAFRRLSKWLPLSAEFRDAQELDDEEPRDVTPIPAAVASPLFTATKPAAIAPPADFTLDATPPDQREDFLARIQALGAPWADVNRILLDNGVTDQGYESADLVESNDIGRVLSQWSTLEKLVKGGVK